MKTIRTSVNLVGLSLVLFALSTVGAKGQVLYSNHFAGKFTLPFVAQWGPMTLPAGNYTLQYGIQSGGADVVVVRGTAKGSPQGTILAGPRGETPASKNAIVCIRDGNALIVRALEMPAIGTSITFGLPRGTKLTAHRSKNGGNALLAEGPMLIQRVSVTLNAK